MSFWTSIRLILHEVSNITDIQESLGLLIPNLVIFNEHNLEPSVEVLSIPSVSRHFYILLTSVHLAIVQEREVEKFMLCVIYNVLLLGLKCSPYTPIPMIS